MKKSILIVLALIAAIVTRAQSSACQFTTCVPVVKFTNSDLLQIYGAILGTGGGAGTSTVYVSNGNVGGWTTKHTVSIPLDGTYTTGVCMGGSVTAVNLFRPVGNPTGVLNDIIIYDPNNQKVPLTIDFFMAPPEGTYTDKANTVINDPTNYIGTIQVSASDYLTIGSIARATVTGTGLTVRSVFGPNVRNLYMVVTAQGTGTYAGNLIVKLGVLLD